MNRKSYVILSILFMIFFLSEADFSLRQKKYKVFISVDMEEIAGMVQPDQSSSSLITDSPQPFRLESPYRYELNFLRSYMTDAAEFIPQVKRLGGRTVQFETEDFIEGFKLLRALIVLGRSR